MEELIQHLKDIMEIYNKLIQNEAHNSPKTVRINVLSKIVDNFFSYIESIIQIANCSLKRTNYNIRNYSVVCLTRILIDCFRAYDYYAEKNISQEELNFRIECATYHEFYNNLKIDKKFYAYDNNFKLFENSISHPMDYLKNFESEKMFIDLDDKIKKQIVKGERCYLVERMNSSINPINHKLLSAIYDMFSNFVHNFNMSIGFKSDYRILKNSGEYQTIMAMHISILFSSLILKNYLSRMKYSYKNEILFLKKYANEKSLISFIKKWHNLYNKDFFSIFSF